MKSAEQRAEASGPGDAGVLFLTPHFPAAWQRGVQGPGLPLPSEHCVGRKACYKGAQGWWSQTIPEMVEPGLLMLPEPGVGLKAMF